jgi:hypothetical protein
MKISNPDKNTIKQILVAGTARVTFTKKDGTERVMNCTLQPSVLPKQEIKENVTERKRSETSLAVYDLDVQGWRSFVLTSVKEIEVTV